MSKEHTKHENHVSKPEHHIDKSKMLSNRIKKKLLKAKRDKTIFLSTTIIFLLLFVATLIFKPYCAIETETETETETEQEVTMGLQAVLLNDIRCKQCDVTGLKTSLQQLFPDISFREIDYASDEAKELMSNTGITTLPALLFTEDIQTEANYAQLANYITPVGEYLTLAIGSSFDPNSEICDNDEDDTGNGLIDCADSTCANTLECRELKENHLAVFIMSDCPYGKEAVKALVPVIEAMPSLEYEINYIVTDNGDGTFISLHGEYEVEENIRQLCAKEQGNEEFLAYTLCRSENGVRDVDWNACADEVGLDKTALEVCFTGDLGKELLSENAVIANDLGIGASPTWLANNRYQFSGITSDVVQGNVCIYNPDLEGCDEALSGDAAVPAGQC